MLLDCFTALFCHYAIINIEINEVLFHVPFEMIKLNFLSENNDVIQDFPLI